MQVWVGLGNPGAKYAYNRHNIGFIAVDEIHDAHRFQPWRRKFEAEVADGVVGGVKTLLVKPQTFMNESGRSVGQALRFYKLQPDAVTVFYDDLDLAPGKLRVKIGGGAGGHNGIRSLDRHLGPEYRRVRLGIGHPGDKARVHGYVLSDFAKADEAWLDPLIDAIGDAAPLLSEAADKFMSRVALLTAPPKPPARAEAPASKTEK